MADIRINKRRMPALQSVDTVGTLVSRLEGYGAKNNSVLTSLLVNGRAVDLDNSELMRLKIDSEDTVEAKMETPQQLSFESLQVAQEMAELLIFDLKVATLHLWDNLKVYEKSMETMLRDCKMFLMLGARPIELLGYNPYELPKQAEGCLRQLDAVANNLEDATLLAVHSKNKEACQVLVGRVLPAIEKWLSMSVPFAQFLEIDDVKVPNFSVELTTPA